MRATIFSWRNLLHSAGLSRSTKRFRIKSRRPNVEVLEKRLLLTVTTTDYSLPPSLTCEGYDAWVSQFPRTDSSVSNRCDSSSTSTSTGTGTSTSTGTGTGTGTGNGSTNTNETTPYCDPEQRAGNGGYRSTFDPFVQTTTGIEGTETTVTMAFRYPESHDVVSTHQGANCQSWTESWHHEVQGNLILQRYRSLPSASNLFQRDVSGNAAQLITIVSPTSLQTSDGHTLTKSGAIQGHLRDVYYATRGVDLSSYQSLPNQNIQPPVVDFFTDGLGRGALVPQFLTQPPSDNWYARRQVFPLTLEYWDTTNWNPQIHWGDDSSSPGNLVIGNLPAAMIGGDTLFIYGTHTYTDTLYEGDFSSGWWNNGSSSGDNDNGLSHAYLATAPLVVGTGSSAMDIWGATISVENLIDPNQVFGPVLDDVLVATVQNGNPFETFQDLHAYIHFFEAPSAPASEGTVRLVNAPDGIEVRVSKQFASSGLHSASLAIVDDDNYARIGSSFPSRRQSSGCHRPKHHDSWDQAVGHRTPKCSRWFPR
jgi:hypothetical protein